MGGNNSGAKSGFACAHSRSAAGNHGFWQVVFGLVKSVEEEKVFDNRPFSFEERVLIAAVIMFAFVALLVSGDRLLSAVFPGVF